MSRLGESAAREDGFALVMVLALLALLALLSATTVGFLEMEVKRTAKAEARSGGAQAAEAATSDYIAKLVSDRLYYTHYVHPGEATRLGCDGSTTTAGQPWAGCLQWTYPARDVWRPLADGYEYSLQITAPTAASQAIRIVATGRPVGSTDPNEWTVLETLVRPSSVADYQMLANTDISYGSTATTYGKIYAGIDSSGVAHSVTHTGQAYGNIYAENRIYGTPTLRNGAQAYDRNTIRGQIQNPVNFSDFLTSLVDIRRASEVGGVFLDNAAVHAWRLTFQNDGGVQAQACVRSGGNNIAAVAPNCGAPVRYAVPSNGAIYAGQSVVVTGVVNGRVTVASNDSIVVGGDISYLQNGDDVLGLVAANDLWVAEYTPYNLNWRAATISQTGAWRSWSSSGSHGTMTFTGSTTTNRGGHMSMFRTRVYHYDDTLQWLQPPWFPTVEDAYTILMSRELTPTP